MDKYTIDETQYKNGYRNGYEDGKKDAVKHARWVKKWHDNDLIGHEYEECSVCGSCIISDTEKFWNCNYCPNCGAKMDGTDNEQT